MNRTYLFIIVLALVMGESVPAAQGQTQAVLFREDPSLEASLTNEERKMFDDINSNEAYIFFNKVLGRYNVKALNSDRVSIIMQGKEYVWEYLASHNSKRGSFLWVGALEGKYMSGIAEASFHMYSKGKLGGSFGLDTSDVLYHIGALNDEIAYIISSKPRNPSPDRSMYTTPRRRRKSSDTLFHNQMEKKQHQSKSGVMITEAIENTSKCDILVVYTQGAEQNLNRPPSAPPLLDQIQNEVNLIFDSSDLKNFEDMNVIAVVKAKNADGSDFVEGNKSYEAILAHLEQTGDGGVLDQVRNIKDSMGADLVVLLARPDNQGNLGVASGPQRQVGSTLFRSPDAGMCYVVINASTIYGQDKCFTLTHEIGHNMGLYHDWANRLASEQPRRSYARGYTRYFANSISSYSYEGDVMAYAATTGFHKLRFFSNPALTYFSLDGNIRAGGIIDTADAARFIDEFYATVKGFAFAPANTILNKPIETQYQMSLYATNDIRNDASFLATSGSDVRFTAGSKVTLKTGFRAAMGSKFVAKIGTGSSASEGLSTAPSGIVAVSTSAAANGERPEKRAATESVSEGSALPTAFALFQNYPNPFNPTTTIRYALPRSAKVVLAVYDVLGRKAMELVNETKAAGFYEVSLNAGSLSSGTYLYRLQAGEYVETRKMVVMK